MSFAEEIYNEAFNDELEKIAVTEGWAARKLVSYMQKSFKAPKVLKHVVSGAPVASKTTVKGALKENVKSSIKELRTIAPKGKQVNSLDMLANMQRAAK